ncbi:MAG TPA: hypothetical protein VFP22_03340, partial [Candidatus Limnocylindrales bacterium]|nr:hypothetical protein [Candidatus Limnocylindrales bacterium]
MPHVPDVLATSHDHHDPIVVAAFAAGDLAGTERDQALALTDSCPDCAALLADLRAIARATAALPPPVRSAGRDFRITPEQAARLDRTGWRRLVPGRSARPSVARPLGVALATFGLMGLLIGNVSFGSLGGASSAGTAVTSG